MFVCFLSVVFLFQLELLLFASFFFNFLFFQILRSISFRFVYLFLFLFHFISPVYSLILWFVCLFSIAFSVLSFFFFFHVCEHCKLVPTFIWCALYENVTQSEIALLRCFSKIEFRKLNNAASCLIRTHVVTLAFTSKS